MSTPAKPVRRADKLDPASVHCLVEDLIVEDIHAKRVLSLANGGGVMHAASLAIQAIGEGLSGAPDLDAKHARRRSSMIGRSAR